MPKKSNEPKDVEIPVEINVQQLTQLEEIARTLHYIEQMTSDGYSAPEEKMSCNYCDRDIKVPVSTIILRNRIIEQTDVLRDIQWAVDTLKSKVEIGLPRLTDAICELVKVLK